MRPWNAYWFRSAPCIDLAVVRILAVACVLYAPLWSGSSLIFQFEQLWSLPDPIYDPITLLRIFLIPWGADFRPDPAFMTVVYYVTLGAAVCSLIGLATNISLLVLTVGYAFIFAYVYSHGDFHHGQAAMVIALGILALSPSGRVLSLDRLIAGRRSHVPQDSLAMESEFAGWPIRLMQWMFVLMYASAALSKLVFISGSEWLNGFTLQYFMIRETLRHGTLLGGWLSQYYYLALLLQYLVVGFQATFVLAVIFPRLRWLYVPAGLAFHMGNWLTLNAPFPEWIALYAVFIPWRDGIRWWQRRILRPSDAPSTSRHVASESATARSRRISRSAPSES
jgi:hypothetical protein